MRDKTIPFIRVFVPNFFWDGMVCQEFDQVSGSLSDHKTMGNGYMSIVTVIE